MLSTMMKTLMNKERYELYVVLHKVSICKEENLYDCCFESECNKVLYDEEHEMELSDEVIYALNENYMELCNHTAEGSEYRYCTIDAMNPRWEFLAENGYKIQEVNDFSFENILYVRMVLHLPYNYDGPSIDLSRIEFAFGKITFGISYIIPLYVWKQRQSEIEAMFRGKGNLTEVPTSCMNGDWENVSIIDV